MYLLAGWVNPLSIAFLYCMMRHWYISSVEQSKLQANESCPFWRPSHKTLRTSRDSIIFCRAVHSFGNTIGWPCLILFLLPRHHKLERMSSYGQMSKLSRISYSCTSRSAIYETNYTTHWKHKYLKKSSKRRDSETIREADNDQAFQTLRDWNPGIHWKL
jgi:hypothetical protein